MAEVGINHLERTEGASVKEVSIGEKTLKSLQTIPHSNEFLCKAP